jgi:hypothetical protein
MDGEDGNFDVVKGSDNVTASWCKFFYTNSGPHNFSNLIGSSDDESISHGKLNVTYAYCWWDKVDSRCPRTRYGKIHVLNSYYTNVGSGAYAGKMSNIRVEGCYFESSVTNPTGLISTGGQAGVFTIDCNVNGTKKDGFNEPFIPPYQYKKYANSEVKSLVNSNAGPVLTNPTNCNPVSVLYPAIPESMNHFSSIPTNVSDNIKVTHNVKQGDDIRMSVLNLNGQKVADMRSKSTITGNTSTTLELKGVQSGVYIFKLSTNGQVVMTQRIIKN